MCKGPVVCVAPSTFRDQKDDLCVTTGGAEDTACSRPHRRGVAELGFAPHHLLVLLSALEKPGVGCTHSDGSCEPSFSWVPHTSLAPFYLQLSNRCSLRQPHPQGVLGWEAATVSTQTGCFPSLNCVPCGIGPPRVPQFPYLETGRGGPPTESWELADRPSFSRGGDRAQRSSCCHSCVGTRWPSGLELPSLRPLPVLLPRPVCGGCGGRPMTQASSWEAPRPSSFP